MNAAVKRAKINHIKDGSPAATFMIYLVIVVLCVIAVYPMYYCVIRSVSDPVRALRERVSFLPKGFTLDMYRPIISDKNMWRSYCYTILYTLLNTAAMLITCVLGGYPLASPKLRGRKFVNIFLIIPMYFSGGLIPSFLNNLRLGLYNNVFAMFVPNMVGIFNIILVRTYFVGLPGELRESAEIDGAGEATVMSRIYVPLSKPVLAVIAIQTLVGQWNGWFGANIYLPNPDLHPLQIYLRRLLVTQNADISSLVSADAIQDAFRNAQVAQQLKYPMIVFTTLPILLIYPFFQKFFVKGVMLGSLKG